MCIQIKELEYHSIQDMGIYSNPTRVFLDYATVTVFFLPHMFIFRPHFVNYIITLGSLFKACV